MVKEATSKKRFIFLITISFLAIIFSFIISALTPLAKYKFLSDDPLYFKILATTAATYDATIIGLNSIATILDGDNINKLANIPKIELIVEPGSIQKMASNLPASAKEKYYNAQLLYPDGQIHDVKYRFRGRSIYHWDPKKPSLRIKTSKKNPFEQLRHFNLINPEDRAMISNFYGDYLADKMEILTHNTKFVELFINQKYVGVYHFTTNDDEEMLRANDRMPGPIYVGDELSDRWEIDQFKTKGDLKAHKNLLPLQILLEAIYAEDRNDQIDGLWSILAKEKYAKFNALLSLVGGIHTDVTHNHLYYFDPSQGRIEPIISDLNGHGLLLYPSPRERFVMEYKPFVEVPLNGRNNPLLNKALRDPDFRHLRNKFLYEYLVASGSFEIQIAELQKLFNMIDPSVRRDRYKASIVETFVGFWRVPYSNFQYEKSKNVIFDWVRRRNEFLMQELAYSKVTFDVKNPSTDTTLLEVLVEGNSAALFDADGFSGSVFKRAENGAKEVIFGKNMLHPGLAEKPVTWEIGRQVYDYQLEAGSKKYLFEIEPGYDVDLLIADLGSAFTNAITGEAIGPKLVGKNNEFNENSVDTGSERVKETSNKVHVLGPGEVILSSNLIVNADEELIVKPGSTILMADGVSVLSKGRTIFDGMPKSPIAVKRLDQDKPWGVIAIHGPRSEGSIIKNVTFSGGSTAFLENRMFSGMLSISWTDNFFMNNSTLEENVVSDDTLHVAHSSFEILNSNFKNCFGDCIDFDYSRGKIGHIKITNAKNDGVDFMRSDVEASHIEVLDAGDKGFSIGEMSHVKIGGSRVYASEIGVAVKDMSLAEIEGSNFSENKVAMSVYSKNWRFGGPGKMVIKNVVFDLNNVDLDVEETAQVQIFDGVTLDVTTGDGTFNYVR